MGAPPERVWCLTERLPWHEHCPGDLAAVFQTDAHMQWGVRESDDARPKREVRWANEPWKPRWLSDLLAAVPLKPRRPCSDSVQVLLNDGHYERFERESHCPDDLGAARHSDGRGQCEASECDDARPKRDLLWEPRPPHSGNRENLPALNVDVLIRAGLVPYSQDDSSSDRERTLREVDSAEIVPQAVLDLHTVVTAAAATSEQHRGQRQRSRPVQRVHRLDSPVDPGGSQSGERDAPVNLAMAFDRLARPLIRRFRVARPRLNLCRDGRRLVAVPGRAPTSGDPCVSRASVVHHPAPLRGSTGGTRPAQTSHPRQP